MYWLSNNIQTTLKIKEFDYEEKEGTKEGGTKRYSNILRLERWVDSLEHLFFQRTRNQFQAPMSKLKIFFNFSYRQFSVPLWALYAPGTHCGRQA